MRTQRKTGNERGCGMMVHLALNEKELVLFYDITLGVRIADITR
jgi:hypothetical protein